MKPRCSPTCLTHELAVSHRTMLILALYLVSRTGSYVTAAAGLRAWSIRLIWTTTAAEIKLYKNSKKNIITIGRGEAKTCCRLLLVSPGKRTDFRIRPLLSALRVTGCTDDRGWTDPYTFIDTHFQFISKIKSRNSAATQVRLQYCIVIF